MKLVTNILALPFVIFITNLLLHEGYSLTSQAKTSIFESFKAYSQKQDIPTSPVPGSIKPRAIDPDIPYSVKELGFEPRQIDSHGKTLDRSNKVVDSSIQDLDMSQNPVKFNGWVKFFKFVTNIKSSGPKAFFVNPGFKEQSKDMTLAKQAKYKDKDGIYINIPDDLSFFCSIYEDKITFSKSRNNFLQTNFDVLRIALITPIADEPGYFGGLVDFGSFKEGFCFKVKTSQSGDFTWIICTETTIEKEMMMKIIKQLKIGTQLIKYETKQNRAKNMIEEFQKKELGFDIEDNANQYLDAKTNTVQTDPKDGYWILLQDWSTCTKSCGGGTQTLHRMCVPPKKGGKACEGFAILNKPCNEQPCESNSLDSYGRLANGTMNAEIKAPQMHVLPFSDRPQRYEKCIVKEADLLMTMDVDQTSMKLERASGQLQEKIQIPVRVVMNLETLTAFSGLEDSDKKASYDLKTSVIQKSDRDPTCFIIKETGVYKKKNSEDEKSNVFKTEFCPFGATSDEDLRNEWDYDFNLFKLQCHQNRGVRTFNQTEIEDELEGKKNQLRLDIINKKQLKAKLEVPQDEAVLEKTKQRSLEAIRKEIKLERLIEKEMKDAQREALEIKAKEVEKENCKMEALEKAIKQKEIENQFNIRKGETNDRILKLESEVKEQIVIKRNRLKEKLARLKEISRQQIKGLDGQIQTIRLEMSNTMNELENNPEVCSEIKASSDFETIKIQYCSKKFSADPEKFLKCKSSDLNTLLYLCCDYETSLNDPDAYDKCIAAVITDDSQTKARQMRFWWDAKDYMGTNLRPSDLRAADDKKVIL
jgi:hypothetical protein